MNARSSTVGFPFLESSPTSVPCNSLELMGIGTLAICSSFFTSLEINPRNSASKTGSFSSTSLISGSSIGIFAKIPSTSTIFFNPWKSGLFPSLIAKPASSASSAGSPSSSSFISIDIFSSVSL